MPVSPETIVKHERYVALRWVVLCVLAWFGLWALAPGSAAAHTVDGTPNVSVSPSGEVTIYWTSSNATSTKLRWDLHDHATYAGYQYDVSADASTPASKQHSRSLRNLPPGDYRYALCTSATCTDAPYEGTFTVGTPTSGDTNTLLDGITTNGNTITAAATFVDTNGATKLWFAGDFTRVGYAASKGIGVSQLGKALPGTPTINGDVTAVTDDGAGGWYIGGDFTEVGGLAIPRVAHILADGGVDASFVSAGLQGTGSVLALDYDARGNATSTTQDVYFNKPRLYVGGNFTWNEANTTTNTKQRDFVALRTKYLSVGEEAGTVLNDFYAEVRNGDGEVRTILVEPSLAPTMSGKTAAEARYIDNAGVYVGGTFTWVTAHYPNVAGQTDVDVGMVAKFEPNGDHAVGALYDNGTDYYKGYFWVPQSDEMVSVDSLALYATGGTGPTFPENTMTNTPRLILGGEFTKIASVSHNGNYGTPVKRAAMNLAAIDSVMGTADNQCFRSTGGTGCPLARPVNLNANGPIKHVAVVTSTATPSANDRLYVAGAFTSLKTVSVVNFGEYALGASPSAWAPPATGAINGTVDALADGGSITSMSVDGTAPKKLYLAGTFDTIMGGDRNGVARILAPAGTLDTWNPGTGFDARQRLVANSSGQSFFAGGFTMVNSVASNSIAALTVDSSGTSSIDTSFVQARPFVPRAGGAWKISTIAGNANRVYVGGDFAITDGNAVEHQNLVALTGAGQIATGFVANPDTPVRALRTSSAYTNGIWVGGDFQNVNLNSAGCFGCKNLALLTDTGAPAIATPANVATDGTVNALTSDSSGHLYVGGAFTMVGATDVQHNLAKLTSVGAPVAGFVDPSGGTSSVVTSVATDDTNVYASGVDDWGTLAPRGIVKVDAATSVIDRSFATAPTDGVSSGASITSLALAGTKLYLAGAFASFESDVARAGLAVVDTIRGRRLGIAKPAHDGSISTVVPVRGRLFAGGTFTTFGNVDARRGLALSLPEEDVTAPTQTVVATPQSARVIAPSGAPTRIVAAGGSGRAFQVNVTAADPTTGEPQASGVDLVDFGAPFGTAFAPWWMRAVSATSATFTTNSMVADAQFHTMVVTTRDRAGNVSSAHPVQVAIDATAPGVATPTVNVAGTSGPQITVDFPATADVGAATIDHRYVERAQSAFVNGACPAAPASTFPAQHDIGVALTTDTWTGLGTACHQIRVRSTDKVQNESDASTAWIPVDLVDPTGTVAGAFPRRVQPTFTITGTARDADSGLDRITATADGVTYTSCSATIPTDDTQWVSYSCALAAPAGANRTVIVKAFDDLQRSVTIGTGSVTVDASLPTLTSVSVDPKTGTSFQFVDPAGGATEPTVWIDPAQAGSFEIDVVGSDDGPLGITASTFPAIGTNWTPGAGPGAMSGGTTATYLYTWSSGALISPPLTGYVKDAANNATAFGFHVESDASDPQITNPVIPNAASAAFDVEADIQDVGSGLAKYEVGLSATSASAMGTPICSQAFTARYVATADITCRVDLPNGTFHVVVKATDHVGRVSESRGDVTISGRSGLFVAPVDNTATPLQIEEDGSTPVNERSFVLSLLNPVGPSDSVEVDLVPPTGTSVTVDGVVTNHVTFNQSNALSGVTVVVSAIADAYADGDVTADVNINVDDGASTIAGIDDTSISVTRLDAQTAGVEIVGAPALDEDGNASDDYTIRLTSRPRGPVTVGITPSIRVTADVPDLTFTDVTDDSDGWNVPRPVTLTPAADHAIQPGGSESVVVTHAITSGDGDKYLTSILIDDADVTIADDDTATVTLGTPTATTVREVGDATPVTFTATLGAQPASGKQVQLVFAGAPTGQVYVTGDDTFTHSNWDQPHTLTVHAVQDPDTEAVSQSVTLSGSVSTDDPAFTGATVASSTFTVIDEDLASLGHVQGAGWVTHASGALQVTEGQTGAQLTIDVGGRPHDRVTITPIASVANAVHFVPASVVIDNTWNGVDPTFQIVADDNTTHESAAVVGTISFVKATIDTFYGPLSLTPISFVVVDDEPAPVVPVPPTVTPTAPTPPVLPPVSTTRGTKEPTAADPEPTKTPTDTSPVNTTSPAAPVAPTPPVQSNPIVEPQVAAPVAPVADPLPASTNPAVDAPEVDGDTSRTKPEPRAGRAAARNAEPRTAIGRWAKRHKTAAAAGTATAVAAGAGLAVKALATKGLIGSLPGGAGGGHGLGGLLDKLHHLRHGRRLRRGGRGGADTELIRKRRSRGAGSPRERSGMHRDVLDELDEKYRPKYDDPLDKFDDAA